MFNINPVCFMFESISWKKCDAMYLKLWVIYYANIFFLICEAFNLLYSNYETAVNKTQFTANGGHSLRVSLLQNYSTLILCNFYSSLIRM